MKRLTFLRVMVIFYIAMGFFCIAMIDGKPAMVMLSIIAFGAAKVYSDYGQDEMARINDEASMDRPE